MTYYDSARGDIVLYFPAGLNLGDRPVHCPVCETWVHLTLTGRPDRAVMRTCPNGHTTPVELLDGWDLVAMDDAMTEARRRGDDSRYMSVLSLCHMAQIRAGEGPL